MVRRRTASLLTAVIVLAAACGGDDGDTDVTDDGAAATGEEVAIRAVEPGPFEDAPATVPAGQVTLRLVNEDQMAHSLRIEELDDGVDEVPGGEEGTATVEFEAGTTYTYFCGVPGHRELGMEGQFEAEG